MKNLVAVFFINAICVSLLISTTMSFAKDTGPAVYVFAHEDDELDVFAAMATDVREGRAVYGVWVTGGDKAGDPAARQKETRSVMKLAGVPDGNLVFLGYPDQEAYKHLKEIYADLKKIVEKIHPEKIMSHAYEGSNIDHDVVALVSAFAAREAGAVHYEFPDTNMYQGRIQVWKFLPRDDSPVMYTPMDKKLYEMKMSTLKMYPSQATGLSAYELAVDKKSLKKQGEPYRVAPKYDFTRPPAEELRYESTSKGTAGIGDFLGAAAAFMADTPVK